MSKLIPHLEAFIRQSKPVEQKQGKKLVSHITEEDIEACKPALFVVFVNDSADNEPYMPELTCNKNLDVTGDCTCFYYFADFKPCRHQVAAALKWMALLSGEPDKKTPAKETVKKAKPPQVFDFPINIIKFTQLQPLASAARLNMGYSVMSHYHSHFEELLHEKTWKGHLHDGKEASVTYKNEHTLTVSCNCNSLKAGALCVHAVAVLLYISNNVSPYYFFQFKDFSEEKKLLLQKFGVTPDTPLAGEFAFNINRNGQLEISKKPEYLLGTQEHTNWNHFKVMLSKPKKTINPKIPQVKAATQAYETGLLFNFNLYKHGLVTLEPVMVFNRKGNKSFKKLPFADNRQLAYLFGLPEPMIKPLERITEEGQRNYLVKNGYTYLQHVHNLYSHLTDTQYLLLNDLMYDVTAAIKPYGQAFTHFFYLMPEERFSNANIKPAVLSSDFPALHFTLSKENGFLQLSCFIAINNNLFPLQQFRQLSFLLKNDHEFFVLKQEDLPTLKIFSKGLLMVHENEQASFLENVVKPLAEKYTIDYHHVIETETIDTAPQGRVYLSELNENFLLIRIKWVYAGMEAEDWDEKETIVNTGGVMYTIIRKHEAEKTLVDAVRSLHPKFTYQTNEYFYLNFQEALHKNWFLHFYNTLLELNVPVYGINELKKFKYNPHKPTFEVRGSSMVDWFDLTITVSYGEVTVPLQELRKAIINKQHYILLGDGSLGMLPEEWIEKYGLLLKMGTVKEGQLKVSKMNWTLIDELSRQMNDGALQQELEEKKSRLKTIDLQQSYPLPVTVKATLRNYQQAGFQWMCLLDDMGWGGCLADDMGLGKTLQTLSFLQHVAGRRTNETHLVVCPTSLIYNWEAELQKFVPDMPYYIHYGAGRVFDTEVFHTSNLIITSYGMVRSDISHFREFQFGYIVLDESQVIKNPASQIARAVQLLQGRNRLILSGTPVQNNTFDLYAQMNFLNPGMLGSQEFFKTEFAQPIDKYGDKEKSAALRRLIYPFLLRRTKEQVAKDLPNKTDMVMWCEMNGEQRKIYESFKVHYRQTILERIAAEGLNKSSIYVLEGLTKLRQICDSPAILNEPEKFPNASVKLKDITREIEENTGKHKALVFSQFTTMLQLIEEALKAHGITYVYLDGSSPAGKRKEAVQQFQEDESIRVFLISLKAGGVGLNLTAADYVYLVDPWWNPAAEQQAIDRTHRIGQDKKVFAYRMICKNTVEEKILQLQEKKKMLAADLISDETGFVKKLTKEDVVYLFS